MMECECVRVSVDEERARVNNQQQQQQQPTTPFHQSPLRPPCDLRRVLCTTQVCISSFQQDRITQRHCDGDVGSLGDNNSLPPYHLGQPHPSPHQTHTHLSSPTPHPLSLTHTLIPHPLPCVRFLGTDFFSPHVTDTFSPLPPHTSHTPISIFFPHPTDHPRRTIYLFSH